MMHPTFPALPRPAQVACPTQVAKPRAAETPTLEPKQARKTQLGSPWKVVVLDDPVNLMSYVVLVFRQVFGFGKEKARAHMLEVHEKGRSILWSGQRERAEFFHAQLQKAQLTAILERDEG